MLSQLNEHEKALEYSKLAALIARDLTHLTKVVISMEVHDIRVQYRQKTRPAL